MMANLVVESWACDPHSHCQGIRQQGQQLPGHVANQPSVQVSISLMFQHHCLGLAKNSYACLHVNRQPAQQL